MPFVSGCLRTALNPSPLEPEVIELANTNAVQVNISITAPSDPVRLGSQFALLVLPIGSVETAHLPELLLRAATKALAVRGFQGVQHSPHSTFTLYISINDLALSGYDALVSRRLAFSTEISGELRSRAENGTETPLAAAAIRHEGGAWKRYAFERELRSIFETEMFSAVDKLVAELGLQDGRRLVMR